MGMEVCKACQPHPSVRVREGEGDAVGAGLRDRVPPFHVGVHGVGGLRGAVHPGGRHGVLVVVPGDLRRCKVNTETEGCDMLSNTNVISLTYKGSLCSYMLERKTHDEE